MLSAIDFAVTTWYFAALSSAQAREWHAAMQHEYNSLMGNGTCEVVDLPDDRVVINYMWIYKVKSDTEGAVSCFKASIVAKGCS
jgi:hypothetical protein